MVKNGKIKQLFGRGRLPALMLVDRILGRNLPRAVVLVVNNACNLRCKYCFGSYHQRSSDKDFTTEQLKSIIDELHRCGTVYFTLHGGETLLRKDIGEIVSYAKNKGIFVNLITNGIFLSEKKLEELKDVDTFCISLDGREENNDIVRGKGTYRAAVKAIDLIKSKGIPLRVSVTLTKYTQSDMRFMAEMARQKNFLLDFSLLFHSTPNMEELIIDEADTRKVLRELIALKKEGYPIFTSYRSLKLALNWPIKYGNVSLTREEYDELRKKIKIPDNVKPIPCGFSVRQYTIDADGNVFPCFSWNKRFTPINIRDVGVKTALERVSKEKTCVLCNTLSHNDWNYMMGLSPSFLLEHITVHLREIFKRL